MDTLKLVDNKVNELGDLYDRMDNDSKLAHLSPYTLRYVDDRGVEHRISGAISITMNDPAIFLNTIISWILSAKWQTFVEGSIPDKQKTNYEKRIDKEYKKADDRLLKSGSQKLFPFIASHICGRGWVAARWVYGEGVLPCDIRWLPFDYGNDGLNWVCNRTFRTPSQIESEYGIQCSGNSLIEVKDWWSSEKNEVHIDGKLAVEVKNTIGYSPFVIVPSPEGFMYLDKGYMVHKGESVFFLNRDMYKPWNQILSMDASSALASLIGSYQIEGTGQNEIPPHPKPGETYEIPPGSSGYKVIDRPDVNAAHREYTTRVQDALKKGGVSETDMGGLSSPMPPSALLVSEQWEKRQMIQTPRLDAVKAFYEQSTKMIVDQSNKFGEKFDGDFDVTYRLMSKSRKVEIANAAIAASLKGTLPRETIMKDIFMADDPEYQISLLEAEEAEGLDPTLKLIRVAFGLIDMAENTIDEDEKEFLLWKSKKLTFDAASMIKQSKMQGFQPSGGKETPDNSALSALIARGG